MKLTVRRFRGLLLLLLALFLSGCPQTVQNQALDEEKEPHYLEGKHHLNTMDYPAAIDSFEKALNANPKSASAHFELGWLYDQKVPDPAAAIYHYEHFLKLRPGAGKAESVKQSILACKQELARTVSLGVVSEKQQRELEKLIGDNLRLTEENKRLADEVRRWRAFYAARPVVQTNLAVQPSPATGAWASPVADAARVASSPSSRTSPPSASPPRPGSPAGASPGPGGWVAGAGPRPLITTNFGPAATPGAGSAAGPKATRTHTVKSHETLSAIARQYGVKLDALTAANPGVNARRLQVGQTLEVPLP